MQDLRVDPQYQDGLLKDEPTKAIFLPCVG